MKLLIISHTEHYRSGSMMVGWGATVREIDHLSTLFDEVIHIAPLHTGSAPASALPYQAINVRLRTVSPGGGDKLLEKLGILWHLPEYLHAIMEEMRAADIVHVRCPANIGLIALIMLILRKTPQRRWFKYAGNWSPQGHEPMSYRIQRWLLNSQWHRGMVTIAGTNTPQHSHIHIIANPCLTDKEIAEGASVEKSLSEPINILYVGRVETAKGIGRAIDVIRRLLQDGMNVRLDVIGDGSQRPIFERAVDELGSAVQFHGAMPRAAINKFYCHAHFLLLPTASEGWPKVLSEGMAYGVIPIASAVSSIPIILSETGIGEALPTNDIEKYAQAIERLIGDAAEWKRQSDQAKTAAARFSYCRYLESIKALLGIG